MKLSKNFSLKEMTASQTAERKELTTILMTIRLQDYKSYVKTYYNQLEITMLHQWQSLVGLEVRSYVLQ